MSESNPVADASKMSFGNRALQSLSKPLVALMQRYMPDAIIFAILLTALTFALAIFLAGATPGQAVVAWGNGFWKLLTFACQMALILVTGLVLAHTPAVESGIKSLVEVPKTSAQAYILVVLITLLAGLLSWGLCVIIGALLSRETANSCLRRGIKVHYPLLVAGAYSGLVIWHQGLSGSIPLKISESNHFLVKEMGSVPLSETLMTVQNIVIILVVLATLPLLIALMRPADSECVSITKEVKSDHAPDHPVDGEQTPAERLNNSWFFNVLIAGAAIAYLGYFFFGGVDQSALNIMILASLAAGMLLTRSPVHYMELAMAEGRSVTAIIMQFPFYAGIMGIMTGTGLVTILADWFVSFSTAETLPFWGMISAGLVNLFVPSGGGQWAVQGPVMIEAAKALGADMPRVAMGVALGDQWTNTLQPFWAIPVLAIAGLQVRDIMGYTAVVFLWTGLVFGLGLLYL